MKLGIHSHYLCDTTNVKEASNKDKKYNNKSLPEILRPIIPDNFELSNDN